MWRGSGGTSPNFLMFCAQKGTSRLAEWWNPLTHAPQLKTRALRAKKKLEFAEKRNSKYSGKKRLDHCTFIKRAHRQHLSSIWLPGPPGEVEPGAAPRLGYQADLLAVL